MKDRAMTFRNVSFGYGKDPLLRDLSFDVRDGEILGVIGPNGAGKSTLIKIAAGLIDPDMGGIDCEGEKLEKLSYGERAKRIAYVPQSSHFPFPFTALEVVLMGRAIFFKRFGFESRIDLDIAHQALADCDCADLARRNIQTLSGGECQRVLIARALAQASKILMLDEPTTHLDIRHASEISSILRRRVAGGDFSVICVLHDLNLASILCDRIIILSGGELIACAPPNEAMSIDNLERAFGSKMRIWIDPESGRPYIMPTLSA